jgi:DNA polymerase-4
MHYLALLQLDGFYVETLKSEGVKAPRGLIVHRDGWVLDADEGALTQKVRRGQSLAEARVLAEGASFVKFEEEPYRKAREGWLDRCAEATHRLEPMDFHTALLDLSSHPAPLRVLDRLRKLLPSARFGLGRSRWVAEVTVDITRPDPSALHDALVISGLPVERLLPATPEERARLRFLGYRTIGEVAEIPLPILRGQFGESAHSILRAAKGGGDAEVLPLWPPASVAGCLHFESPPETEEGFRAALRTLAEEVSRELDRRDLKGESIVVLLETEAGIEKRTRTFTRSLQSVGSVFSAIALTLVPLPTEPLLSITVRLPQLKPAERVQLDLGTGGRSRSDADAGVNAAFRHVRSVFGDASIQLASRVEEPRRKRVLQAWRNVTGWS